MSRIETIFIKGRLYKGRHTKEILIYLGENWSGNGYWHQFALLDKPDEVWSECLTSDLAYLEEVKEGCKFDLTKEMQFLFGKTPMVCDGMITVPMWKYNEVVERINKLSERCKSFQKGF